MFLGFVWNASYPQKNDDHLDGTMIYDEISEGTIFWDPTAF